MFVIEPDVLCVCGNKAVVMLELHAVGFCTDDEPTVAAFKCGPCRDRDVQRAQEMIDEDVWCVSCGLIIVTLSDMIVRQCPIGAK